MANRRNQAQANSNINLNNQALHLALQSAAKRGLFEGEITFQVARQIAIASSHYYKHLTGALSAEECRAAVTGTFEYQQQERAEVY